mmetsp:Transcript_50910/g.87577  ORF Transcript_50910/g.87577 Transcript_50910/m.87577 type:complete len:421 (+) Transcript_50910:70-1332(+)
MPCDTFVAVKSGSSDGNTIFGKNSDRPEDEVQNVHFHPARSDRPGGQRVRCTYMEIPEAEGGALATVLSQPFWMWGAEMGANEAGVAIGNEAVWTKEPDNPQDALLGMDLVRLGLERGDTARGALDAVVALLEEHGQGGSCAASGPRWEYHNSFLIADSAEAWVLETAGRHWAAERVADGVRNISNNLSIHRHDLCSDGLEDYAIEQGYWSDRADGPFSFARAFSSGGCTPDARECAGRDLLAAGPVDTRRMMEILRSHRGGICMHGGFASTGSQVSRLGEAPVHFFTGSSGPCQSLFKPFLFASNHHNARESVNCGKPASQAQDQDTLWWAQQKCVDYLTGEGQRTRHALFSSAMAQLEEECMLLALSSPSSSSTAPGGEGNANTALDDVYLKTLEKEMQIRNTFLSGREAGSDREGAL